MTKWILEPTLRAAVIAPLLLTSSCVSSARYRDAVALKNRLANENVELQRSLAEARVRAQEAMEALAGGRPPQGTGGAAALAATPPDAGEASALSGAIAPEGFSSSASAIADEDVRASSPSAPQADGAEGILKVARTYSSAGRAREAIDAYTRLVSDFPFSPLLPQAFLERGRLRFAGGDRKGALEDFDTVSEAFPASAQAPEARRQGARLRH